MAALYEMLAEYSPADSVLLKKPTVKKNLDPELRKLRQISERRNAPHTARSHLPVFKQADVG